MPRFFQDHLEFFRQFRERFYTTGAVAPSSRFLANAMAGPLSKHRGPKRVLEVGPGTGAVTQRIVRSIGQDDVFDLVEINDVFAQMIKDRFHSDDRYRPVADQANVHVCPLQEFEAEEKYDFIVSGLPMNNFPSELVSELFESFFRLLKPNGVLSYFEYMYVRSVRRRISKGDEARRLRELDEIAADYGSRFQFRRSWVFVNFPPAWVQHLRNADSDRQQPETKESVTSNIPK